MSRYEDVKAACTDPRLSKDFSNNPHMIKANELEGGDSSAPLARTEGAIAFGHLLERFPGLRLAVPEDRLAWRPGLLMHGLTSLPVRSS
ncbi:hypothetical protein [Nonomuraea sp. CA-141351]|uniref:hypothetical protein n=1 Tax=Nonomuraea sp. CA-141351 TaxID=3239996 RepID=UPI003D8E97E0